MRERLIRYPFVARMKPSAYRAAHTARPARFFSRETTARGTIGVYGLRRASHAYRAPPDDGALWAWRG